MGLGPYPEITLATAREQALDARRLVKDGPRPVAERSRGDGADLQGGGRGADREQAPGLAQRQACGAVGLDARDLRLSQARRARREGDRHARTCSTCCGRSGPRSPRPRAGCASASRRCSTTPPRSAPRPATTRRAGRATSTTCWPSRARSGASSTMRPSTGARRRLHGRAGAARGHRGQGAGVRDPDRRPLGRGARHDLGRDRRRGGGVDRARRPDQGRQGAPGAADGRGLALLGERGASPSAGVPEPDDAGKPAVRHDADGGAEAHGPRRPHAHGFRSTFRDWAGETTATRAR